MQKFVKILLKFDQKIVKKLQKFDITWQILQNFAKISEIREILQKFLQNFTENL